MKNYAKLIEDFTNYCVLYYNYEDGIFAVKFATEEKITIAVERYLESKSLAQIYFDSYDREQVKQILKRL
jgi:hypothetical protein